MGKAPEQPKDIEEKRAASLYSKTDLLKVVADYFNDALPRTGYEEEHFWTNVRIMLCIMCCSFGVYAQFGTKFPKDRVVLGLCVCGYFVFSAILAAVDYLVIATSVMCIKIGEDSVFVDVNLPAFSEEISLQLRCKDKTVSHKCSVGLYFDSEGLLEQGALFNDFVKLVKEYEGKGTGKKDKNL
mmetsp:Transcript_24145/g.61302  ORF Transcript_24145/g.61302 Transcript_24145/m.61302 type:complete len:184 (+) Transcript_24145:147-698(+)